MRLSDPAGDVVGMVSEGGGTHEYQSKAENESFRRFVEDYRVRSIGVRIIWTREHEQYCAAERRVRRADCVKDGGGMRGYTDQKCIPGQLANSGSRTEATG